MAYTGTKALTGKGTILNIGSTPVEVGEIKSIKLSGRKNNTEDVTNMDSTQMEFISTIADPGQWALEGNRVPGDAGQVAMEAAFSSGAITPFTIVLPKATGQVTSGDKYTFNALVMEVDYAFEPTKADSFSATLKVSGAMTFVPGA